MLKNKLKDMLKENNIDIIESDENALKNLLYSDN